MAQTEVLYVRCEETPEDVVLYFFRQLGLTPETKPVEYGYAPGIHASASGVSATARKILYIGRIVTLIPDWLHFTPTIEVGLWGNREIFQTARTSIMQATLKLIYETAWDAALKFQYGDLVLRHINGELKIAVDEGIWTPERLKLITIPYSELPASER
jgi:hypothetical protein